MLHIVISFNTGYKDRNDEIEFNRTKIAKRYFFGMFWFDLLVSFPFVTFEDSLGKFGGFIAKYHNPFFSLRLLRIINILEINDKLNYIANDVFKSSFLVFIFRLLSIICVILCVAHVGGCIWFKIGEQYVRIFLIVILIVFSY